MYPRFLITTTLLFSYLAVASDDARLRQLNIDGNAVTVSGLSSGGYMANQFHIAHSDWVSGAAMIASGPYYCGQNSIEIALSQCVNKVDTALDTNALTAQLLSWAEQGKIAAPANLKDDRVWLFHGTADQRVAAEVTHALYEQYQQLGSPANITLIDSMPFAHHFPTLSEGHACDISEAPFLGKCNYDAAGELLTHLLGPLKKRAQASHGELVNFSQQQWGASYAESLADDGYLYLPSGCIKGQKCRLHINFHGCNQNVEAIGEAYVRNNGLNQWAESNNIVVLYPQTKKSLFMPLNPQACWDWWGYTSDTYATREGAQVKAVATMVEKLISLNN